MKLHTIQVIIRIPHTHYPTPDKHTNCTRRGYDYFFGMYGGFSDYFTHISAEPESPDNSAFDLHEHFEKDIQSG